jgi:hypothetical protein
MSEKPVEQIALWTDPRSADPVKSDNLDWLKMRVRDLQLCTLDALDEVDRLHAVLEERQLMVRELSTIIREAYDNGDAIEMRAILERGLQ